ncbi:hypothetical protein P153DRAFT_70823 [Dothidotthia symphoricarpi CBS 119687]|uniref:Zn(2)-C6 fungal-type domain-containing protein n=1 Tax=Dothidotthia symphoricarpi CBS 119687 TaxID=1392245 RepID=A0A6A6A6S5_9PLEO|nr:uncharacterized protein P153DRAFT_70823 [Dothidotthia symphoricarpi CBS 119687]KAF2126823.1 hypothetical protein P153DRAFT_70823 [Dothidotthia symphoricarpi CBS 119687]
MSTPCSTMAESVAMQQTTASPAAVDEDNMGDIPRRPMRVKVLYTFDDQNKSNCLARLPNALNVPVVALDENTQVGVIELKTCIQAIVAASPELVARLGHDYTVYAYDFSEYETPLVGQGMLSWILASASTTPNAPADESQTMVTGRVCKNILGLFSNGIKETLEVKLKLVPVPTCMQKEYVENMERYHSLSQLMPEKFDYNAWADFLKENPTLGQLAQPAPGFFDTPAQRSSFGGVEPFHQMLTRHSPSQEPMRNDAFFDESNMSFNSQPTRASSPAMSSISFHHYQYNPDSRPASRASVRSEAGPVPQQHAQQHTQHHTQQYPQQYPQPHTQQFPNQPNYVIEEQEDGPPRKRARITQAKRPKKTPLLTHHESLRVTASTAASVRLHKPLTASSAAALASAELVPRAPTPRPGDAAFGPRGLRRPPAPSTLRHASMDGGRPYMSPYDTSSFSDNATDSADDERGVSPGDTPTDLPSSPPLVPKRTVSPSPSSPNLPTLPPPTDSGFVSDMVLGREDDGMESGNKTWDGSDLPTAPEARAKRKQTRSQQPWQEVNPGPTELLPQSYVPRPKQYVPRSRSMLPITESVEQDTDNVQIANSYATRDGALELCASRQQQSINGACTKLHPGQDMSQPDGLKAGSPDTIVSYVSPASENEVQMYSRSATPNLPTQKPRASRARGLPRSHTWSGAGEPMSDAPISVDGNPRSGGHAKRKKQLKEKLEKAIAAGEMPEHCNNCGEIDTPTWRKAYTRVELGSPDGIELSTEAAGTGIVGYEVIEPTEDNIAEKKYRIFKNNITPEEKTWKLFEALTLCNPCGLWLIKKKEMRPQKQWNKAAKPAKRKRNQTSASRSKSLGQDDDLVSDAVVPPSDAIVPVEQETIVASFQGALNEEMLPPPHVQERAESFQTTENEIGLNHEAAQAAFRRAVESSPAGFRGSKNSPIDIDPDLTPRPTRRILFPSPRKDGETKSLVDNQVVPSTTSKDAPSHVADKDAPIEKPRCERCKKIKKGCDRERPCQRCKDAGIGHDGCIPCDVPKVAWFNLDRLRSLPSVEQDTADKENCPPPPVAQEDHDFTDLFEDPVSPIITPKKSQPFQDLLKTPTPGSRRRPLLTPKRGAESAGLLLTPSRNIFTPRGSRAATMAPETPFTRQLNALLKSDGITSSPGQALDFSEFPSFNTPGRTGTHFTDFMPDDFLSSDMPMTSSPPRAGTLGLGFDLYEDPNTSTIGLWSDANIFGSDLLMSGFDDGHQRMELVEGPDTTALLKMNVGGITVDFASMIEDVVGVVNNDADMEEIRKSTEVESQSLAKTPETPVTE